MTKKQILQLIRWAMDNHSRKDDRVCRMDQESIPCRTWTLARELEKRL